jgi:hypothetical protein
MSRFWAVLTASLLAVALTNVPAGAVSPEPPDLSVKGLVAAASKYVARYEQEFAFLVADEAYTQTRLQASTAVQSRELRSEMFLAFLPVDKEWIAVRDVMRVDGAPVAGRDDLRALLSRREAGRGVVSEIVESNARYNIGKVTRNFNEPTLPLLLFDAKRVDDVKFEKKTVVKEGDTTLVTLGFSERGKPTLVRGPEGSMPARGELIIEAGTGVVRRTKFELDRAGVKVRLTTDYAPDARLGLWLPTTFTERYDSPEEPREIVVCEATYSNYRRFDVTAKIK